MSAAQAAAAQQALAQLPACAAKLFAQAQGMSGCGMDQVCLCTSEKFLGALQVALPLACTYQEQSTALAISGKLCLEAVPALNGSRQPLVIGVTTTVTALLVIAVVLRFWARKMSNARWGWDDWLIIIATFFTLGLNTISFVALRFGSGLHAVRLTLDDITSWGKIFIAFQLDWAVAVTAIKLSILAFYHRIFPMRPFTYYVYGMAAFQIAWFVSDFIAACVTCRPFAYNWNKRIPNGYCFNSVNFSYAVSAINVATDFIILLMPIPWILKLQLDTRRKLAIAGIFLLGSFTCIAAIVRIPLLTWLKIFDLPYTSVPAGVWLNVECSIGIVSACLPVMRPLFNMAPSIPKVVKSKLTGHSVRASEINTAGFSGKTAVGSKHSKDSKFSKGSMGSIGYPEPNEKKGHLPLNAAQMGYHQPMGYQSQWPNSSLHSQATEGSEVEALPAVGVANSAYGAPTRPQEDLELGILKETEVMVDSHKR